MACQPDGLLLVRVLSLPVVVLWSAWWLMTALWRGGQGDIGSPCMCVCMSEGFYMLRRGSLSLEAFSAKRRSPPCSVFALLLQQKKKRRRRRRGVWGVGGWLREREDREGGQTQGITLSNTHTVTGPLQKTQIPYLTSPSASKGLFHSVNGS